MAIGLDTSVDTQTSAWGAAFRKKPIFFMTVRETEAFFNGKLQKNMTLLEDSCTLSSNNSYRNHAVYEVKSSDKEKTFLDLGFLIKDESSSLKGTLDSEEDVDFYNFTIPFHRTIQNNFNVEIRMDLPEGSHYQLTLYDEYGNQVGRAAWNGENQKTLTVPNWDTKSSKYCIKIENEAGESVRPNDSYQISFHVLDNQETQTTDAIRESYGELQNAYSRKDKNWRKYLDNYNALLQEAEKNYVKEVEQLHQKQFDSLPEEKKYRGERTVEELLCGLAEGETLKEEELEYLKIFANLKEMEQAKQQCQLKKEFTEEFAGDLNELGISLQDLEQMQVKMESDGTVTVDKVADETIRKQVEQLITEKYGDRLYRFYIGIADSVNHLPSNVYQLATDIQETERFLKKATGGEVSLEELYFTSDGKIGGLPENIASFINQTKNNAKAEELRTRMQNIISYKQICGEFGIPRFTSSFQFENGTFLVSDSGFANDVEKLAEKMKSVVSADNMYAGIYQYQFEKVL